MELFRKLSEASLDPGLAMSMDGEEGLNGEISYRPSRPYTAAGSALTATPSESVT